MDDLIDSHASSLLGHASDDLLLQVRVFRSVSEQFRAHVNLGLQISFDVGVASPYVKPAQVGEFFVKVGLRTGGDKYSYRRLHLLEQTNKSLPTRFGTNVLEHIVNAVEGL